MLPSEILHHTCAIFINEVPNWDEGAPNWDTGAIFINEVPNWDVGAPIWDTSSYLCYHYQWGHQMRSRCSQLRYGWYRSLYIWSPQLRFSCIYLYHWGPLLQTKTLSLLLSISPSTEMQVIPTGIWGALFNQLDPHLTESINEVPKYCPYFLYISPPFEMQVPRTGILGCSFLLSTEMQMLPRYRCYLNPWAPSPSSTQRCVCSQLKYQRYKQSGHNCYQFVSNLENIFHPFSTLHDRHHKLD